MIFRLATVLAALLLTSFASAFAWPQEPAPADLSGMMAEGSSPVEVLDAAFKKLHTNPPSKPVATTRNELINGACKDVIVIFARGTTEPGNVGDDVGPIFFSNLDVVEPGRVIVQGVDYPADVWGYLTGGSDSGAKNMANLVGKAASNCPSSKIVLSGFSQGAQVTHKAAARIPVSLHSKVAAIVLFGDPNKGTPFPGTLNNNVKTFCHEGDLICLGWPVPLPAHQNYENDAPEAAAYVAARV